VTEHDADGLHRELDGLWRVRHRPDLGEVLLPDVPNGGLGIDDGWLGFGEVGHDDGASLLDLDVLFGESGLDLDRGGLLLLCFLLIGDHPPELIVRFGILGLELGTLDGEAPAELFDLRVLELVESDVEMALLLLELVSFLVEESDVVIDAGERKRERSTFRSSSAMPKGREGERSQVEVMPRGDVVRSTLLATETSVDGVHRLMDMDEGVDDGESVGRGQRKLAVSDGEGCRGLVGSNVEIESLGELVADLVESLIGPVSEPVENASVEERGGSSGSAGETITVSRKQDRARTELAER
jgi:hypothetical protein